MNANERKWDGPFRRNLNSRSSVFIRGSFPSGVSIRAIRGSRPRLSLVRVTATVIALLGTQCASAIAQVPEADPEVEVQAAVGEPLGVGKMIVRFAPGRQPVLVRGQRTVAYRRRRTHLLPCLQPDFDRRSAPTRQPGASTRSPPTFCSGATGSFG